ncbi:ABC transporter permease [Pseudomonas aeruginosa]|nr:ABC transporter permease [Pseudomonas aeruginosa]
MLLSLEPRGRQSRWMLLASPLLAGLLTLVCGALLFACLGHDPWQTLHTVLVQPVSDLYGLGELLVKAMPILLCALGLALAYQARVWNIGAEGQLLVGALAGSAVAIQLLDWQSRWALAWVLLAGTAAGALWAGFAAWLRTRFNANEILTTIMLNYIALNLLLYGVHGPLKDPDGFNFPQSALFAGVALYLNANQVACGLALTIFGVGLSSFVGAAWVGKPLQGFAPLALPVLGELPLLGRMLFAQDALVYLSLALFAAVAWMLLRSRAGLVLQAVGENPDAASAMGLPVLRVRTLAVLFGGAMAGLAGAYLSLAYTPMWAENMTAGRGWIALALVVFASWRVFRVLLGAWLFGLASILHLVAQGIGLSIPANLLAMLPYAATILVLVLLSRDALRTRLYAPVSLGQPWKAGH